MSHGLSNAESAHRKWLEENTADESRESTRTESSPAIVGTTLGANIPVRQRQRMAEEADAATPAARAANERAALSSMYEAHHLKLKAEEAEEKATAERKRQAELTKQENIRREAARVAEARRVDALRDKEAREAIVTKAIEDSARKEIMSTLRQYDLVGEVDAVAEVVRKDGLGMKNPDVWRAVCQSWVKRAK